MNSSENSNIRERTRKAAEVALKANGSVGPIELLQAMGFLNHKHVENWKRGISEYTPIEEWIQCGPGKLKQVYEFFQQWAQETGLKAEKAPYMGKTVKGTGALPITVDGNPAREEFYITRYMDANVSPAKAKRIRAKMEKVADLVVFKLIAETACQECGRAMELGDYITMENEKPLCLDCADLDCLEFLPAGDATLSRRARKHSALAAVVVRYMRSRNRYERQGILVTPEAIAKAEAECFADAAERAERRVKDAQRRQEEDRTFIAEFAQAIQGQYSRCPVDVAGQIAAHAAERSSGRVGRSALGRALDARAVTLAVRAHVRHVHTNYDLLLMQGVERMQAREQIHSRVEEVLSGWL